MKSWCECLQYLRFLFHCLMIVIIQGMTGECYTQFSKEEVFQQQFDQAAYGQISYDKRLDLFESMRQLIPHVGDEAKKSFVTALRGLVSTRLTNEQGYLWRLRDLISRTFQASYFQEYSETGKKWIDLLNKDLMPYALKNGDIVRLKTIPHENFLGVSTIEGGKKQYKLSFFSERDAPCPFSLLFRVRKEKADSLSICFGDPLFFEPLYAACEQGAARLDSLACGIECFVHRGSSVYESCFVCPKQKPTHALFSLNQCCSSFTELSNVPVLPYDDVIIKHVQTGMTFFDDSFNQGMLNLRRISGRKYPSSSDDGRDTFISFHIDRVSYEQRKELENSYMKMMLQGTAQKTEKKDKTGYLEMILGLFSTDVSQALRDEFAGQVQVLFEKRDVTNIVEMQELKRLLGKISNNIFFQDKKIVVDDWLGRVEDGLTQLGIAFEDIISLASGYRGKRVLWVYDQSRFSKIDSLDILAGPNGSHNTIDGPQLFRISSPEGKQGVIRCGDHFVLHALFAGDESVRSLGEGKTLWVNPASYCGKSFYEVLVGPNECHQARNGQHLFCFKKPLAHEVSSVRDSVLPGDSVELWSLYFNRKIWVNQGSLSFKNAHNILVGPNDDNFNGVNRTQNGQQIFIVSKIPQAQMVHCAEKDFLAKLKNNYLIRDCTKKVQHLDDMLSYLNRGFVIPASCKSALVTATEMVCLDGNVLSDGEYQALLKLLGRMEALSLDPDHLAKLIYAKKFLERRKVEGEIDELLARLKQESSPSERIEGCSRILPLMSRQISREKAELLIEGIADLVAVHETMDASTLMKLNELLTKVSATAFPVENLSLYEKLRSFEQLNLSLPFKAHLVQAMGQQGLQQIESYKKMLGNVNAMNLHQRLDYLKNLKDAFEKKISEVRSMQELLEIANLKVLSDNQVSKDN